MENQKLIRQSNKIIFKGLKNYFLLTKPKVLTLLIFTSVSGAFLAKQGIPNLFELTGLLIGGYCASGSAATLNLSLIHICRCRRAIYCRTRWSP